MYYNIFVKFSFISFNERICELYIKQSLLMKYLKSLTFLFVLKTYIWE